MPALHELMQAWAFWFASLHSTDPEWGAFDAVKLGQSFVSATKLTDRRCRSSDISRGKFSQHPPFPPSRSPAGMRGSCSCPVPGQNTSRNGMRRCGQWWESLVVMCFGVLCTFQFWFLSRLVRVFERELTSCEHIATLTPCLLHPSLL